MKMFVKALARLNTFLGAAPDQLHSTSLPLVHLNLVIYSCAFWMQQPVLPEKLKSLQASEIDFGSIQSLSAVLALLGSTVMGRIVDVYGARTGLLLAQAASAAMYFLAGYASSIPEFYLTAFPAFFQHAMLCCSAAVATLSSPEARAPALGRLGLSYGVGMAAGSPIGGYIATHFGMEYAFLSASLVSLAISTLNIFVLPRLQDEEKKASGSVTTKGIDMAAVLRVAIMPGVRDLLVVALSSGLATSAFRAMFALAAIEEFGLSSQDLGYLMSFSAFVGLITNVFLISWTLQILGEHLTLAVSLFVQAISYIALSHAKQDAGYVTAVSIPQTIASTIFYTLSSSLMTKCVSGKHQGTVVSLSHATRSSTQVLAPLIGGYMMTNYRFGGVCILASAISFLGGLYAVTLSPEGLSDANEISLDEKKEEKTRVE